MPLMTNAEAFEYDFGIYATELWSMTEEQFLEWLNANCDRERPMDMIVHCKDCKHWIRHDRRCGYWNHGVKPIDWCCHGERKDDE